ncbi:hypothetical protein A2899_02740 [Candidatus Amesbacteria bacterium RIFCSPLOWO2_01_FULL_49_25]|uniref:Putative phage metallopeptidase domain-containing protein n=1 Tax=Candidatus Amesbacteria bacterium RIFCSPHIGHO2_01_FULL_48_32b TaxID=1797253 RepID=A0A1F4YF40_9BACT|nr:MAG: hypothetical protein A2876_04275 [Candidatus Amesbacteria bacterium RIFCSPHIGHO2_01_FULL_48_32b]OGD08263.1 MAG: hypothetical protein A2899_02740 [Candidatus Amesbacteria bacterium RIFCSPLOWO2_01_FULL_49_25]
MKWTIAPDITNRINFLVPALRLSYIRANQIHSFRSSGSSSRATARIWSLPTIWQQALHTEPSYCLEVISERFDKLKLDDQERVLIHELLHIPKTFSGALVPHRSHFHGRRTYKHYHDTVESLFRSLTAKSYN